MPKLDLTQVLKMKNSTGEITKLKGLGFSWEYIVVGPSYPSGGALTLEDFGSTGDDNTAVSLTFATAGTYLVAIFGASGGAGTTDSPVAITAISTFDVTFIGADENIDYEEAAFSWVEVTTPGTYPIEFSWSGTSYRRGAVAWKSNGALDFSKAAFTHIEGYSSTNIEAQAGMAIAATSNGRGGAQHISGLAIIDADDQNLEATDQFAISHENVTVAGTKTITASSTGETAARTMTGIVTIPYKKEFPTMDWALTNVIIGVSLDKVAIRRSKAHAILGTKLDTVDLRLAKSYVILE